jgi:hypothetical protein
MSDRFVSGGTISTSGEPSKDESGHEAVAAAAREPLMKKNAEWQAVQHELEEDRKKREQARADLASEGQQSLYDILQANKGLWGGFFNPFFSFFFLRGLDDIVLIWEGCCSG